MRFKLQISRSLVAAFLGALLTAGLGFVLMWWSIGRGLVNRSYDFLIIARGDQAATDAVIVYLDEKSHAELGQPLDAPWDRALHGRRLEPLTAAGAKVIVFDIVFCAPHTNTMTFAPPAVRRSTRRAKVI